MENNNKDNIINNSENVQNIEIILTEKWKYQQILLDNNILDYTSKYILYFLFYL